MKRAFVLGFAVIFILVAFAASLLAWASATERFLFTQSLKLQEYPQNGPVQFQNGLGYSAGGDILASGTKVGGITISVGPPYANSSQIPVSFEVWRQPNIEIDSIKIAFSSSVHNPLTYEPDFYLIPPQTAGSLETEFYTTKFANEVVVCVNDLGSYGQEAFHQELLFSPTLPKSEVPLEYYFNITVTMHEIAFVQLTSLQLKTLMTLKAAT